MPDAREVVATVERRHSSGRGYSSCIFPGGKIVLVRGDEEIPTKVTKQPFSSYHLEGTRIVRVWDPKAAEKHKEAEARANENRAIATSDPFLAALGSLERFLGAKAIKFDRTISFEDPEDDDGIAIHIIPTSKKRLDIISVQDALAPQAAVPFWFAGQSYRDEPVGIGVVASLDPFSPICLLTNCINEGVEPENAAMVLRKRGARVWGSTRDTVTFCWEGSDVERRSFAAEVVRSLRPTDLKSSDLAKEMKRDSPVTLWWD